MVDSLVSIASRKWRQYDSGPGQVNLPRGCHRNHISTGMEMCALISCTAFDEKSKPLQLMFLTFFRLIDNIV